MLSVLVETGLFIEWASPEASAEARALLAEVEAGLAGWQSGWERLWSDPASVEALAAQARSWSDRVLETSGLLEDST
ncbi:MAG TPA: hypothetical protein VKT77_16915 [Chthonomonadaceae bacterium]|nr:hypothetical protein [Chthonomonadaceae bacterium]